MIRNSLATLARRWQTRSLSAKLLAPIVGLMLLSLLGSALTFVVGTALTQDLLLSGQIAADAERVQTALTTRADTVATAADLLAHDASVVVAVSQDSETAGRIQTLGEKPRT